MNHTLFVCDCEAFGEVLLNKKQTKDLIDVLTKYHGRMN